MNYLGSIMTPEQAAQVAQTALQAPLNTLVAIVAILCIIVVVGIIAIIAVIVWKFVPTLLNQYQQQLDTNKRLTDIAEKNTQALQENTSELSKQTSFIDTQTTEVKKQSEGFEKVASQVAANTSSVNAFETILKSALEALPQQIVSAIDDTLKCQNILKDIQALRLEVAQVLSQQQAVRKTSTQPIVPPVTDGNKSP